MLGNYDDLDPETANEATSRYNSKKQQLEAQIQHKEEKLSFLSDKISEQGFKSLSFEEIKKLDELFDLYIEHPDKCSEKTMSVVKSAVIDFDTFKYLSLRAQLSSNINQNQIICAIKENAQDLTDKLKPVQTMAKSWATKEKLNLLKNL